MPTTKTSFKCSSCSYSSPKWIGKCPECNSWNTFTEVIDQVENSKTGTRVDISYKRSVGTSTTIENFAQVLEKMKTMDEKRFYSFANKEMDSFWGSNGLVAGSLTLLAGEPGLGKSTFCLQLLRSLRKGTEAAKLLYITAEESTFELARRSERLKIPSDVLVLQANNLESISKIIEENNPSIVVLDSVQTVYSSKVDSNPGSVAQVSTVTSTLLSLSKSLNISIILVGHVTKDGQIAGPKTLEHLVDSVLFLERSENPLYRTLSFSKHRFGSTDNLLLLKMEESGLSMVKDASLALLENIENGVGVVYSIAMEKSLPLIVEVQALVNANKYDPEKGSAPFGRREAIGIPSAKLNTILALMDKYLGINLKSSDVYVQVFGLPKSFYDDSLDFAVMLSIISSINNLQIDFLYPKLLNKKIDLESKTLFAGRLTLSGNLRKPTNLDVRNRTATKLGFDLNPSLDYNQLKIIFK
ncbi:MAG: AAA family ATPase [Patescibacteria group bacterium]